MPEPAYDIVFPQHVLDAIFPTERADQFFEALFGDSSEGAYDIVLAYTGASDERIDFEFQLNQRPGRCLACNLTYGLPEVFMRHPVIDVAGVVRQIDSRMVDGKRCGDWTLGRTREVSPDRHVLPLMIHLAEDEPAGAA